VIHDAGLAELIDKHPHACVGLVLERPSTWMLLTRPPSTREFKSLEAIEELVITYAIGDDPLPDEIFLAANGFLWEDSTQSVIAAWGDAHHLQYAHAQHLKYLQ
jgi:hypothetical protein